MSRSLCASALLFAVVLAAGPALAAPPPPNPPPGDVVTNPNWVRKPDPEQLLAVFPKKALQKGSAGKATIECEVAVDGLLRACRVISESPPGMDFGLAAISLTPQFRFKPATRNGVPFPAKVMIPINWDAPGMSSNEGPAVITNPLWAEAPTHADLRAAYPKGRKDGGSVFMSCFLMKSGALRDCQTQTSPAFQGAALRLARKFRVDVSSADPKLFRDPVEVHFVIHFNPSDAAEGAVDVVDKPKWTLLPALEDFRKIFPQAALAKGIKSGHGVVTCTVAANGVLAGCSVTSEDPPGLGFGEAALKLSATFRLDPWTEDGRPVDGSPMTIPIKLVYPDDTPDKTAAPKS
ncbi:MAG TPA: TonB family protein [Caulobacteraceae bacterium]|jgi:TonB family protein